MKTFLVSICAAMLCVGHALAQPPPSGVTASAEVLTAWLEAFNAGDERVQAFHARHGRGDPRDVERDRDLLKRTGGFDLQKIESADDTRVIALLRERGTERFGRIQIDVAPGSPSKIVGMRLQPAAAPTATGIHGLAGVGSFLAAETAADRFAGAVIVAKDGAVVFEHAYGSADRDLRLPNSLSTRFRIGSMNKMFTAVAILQLAEAGKLDLDDPLVKFLPDFPNRELARLVTIDQLLTHRGGTGDFFGSEYFARKDALRKIDDYIALVGARKASFEPGERFAYSNFGYILLGAIVERVTNRGYYDYVQTEIYDRAGMKSSGSAPESDRVEGLSVGYTREGGGPWRANTAGLPYRGTPAGGGYSTVGDLLAFAEALRASKLLGEAYTKKMLDGYALRSRPGATGFVGHNGGSPGMNGDLRIYPRTGHVVIALANLDPPAADAVTDLLDRQIESGTLQ